MAEFPDDFSPVATPLDGSERLLAEKGTTTVGDVKNYVASQIGGAEDWAEHPATQDVDMDGHDVVGLPAYSGSSPPADLSAAASFATVANAMTDAIAAWATAPAAQDVDMDGHKITNLGAPSASDDAATKQYVDTAVPELEWWAPVWTPLSNVDSVSNVECQYTRTYRAAGGSLVTLEGTITVEIDEDDEPTILSAPLPVPATSTGAPIAPAIGVDISRGDRADCRATVTDLGSGPVLVIAAGELSNATGVPATLTIGFRISYRAV